MLTFRICFLIFIDVDRRGVFFSFAVNFPIQNFSFFNQRTFKAFAICVFAKSFVTFPGNFSAVIQAPLTVISFTQCGQRMVRATAYRNANDVQRRSTFSAASHRTTTVASVDHVGKNYRRHTVGGNVAIDFVVFPILIRKADVY